MSQGQRLADMKDWFGLARHSTRTMFTVSGRSSWNLEKYALLPIGNFLKVLRDTQVLSDTFMKR